MFREELHPRDSGRFATKPGSQGQHSNGSPNARGVRGPDAHSQAVPPQIRESEKRRLLQMMGDNPTPQKEKQVLTSEASRLHTKARGLLDEVRGSRDQQQQAGQAKLRGAQRHQAAEQKRQAEDAARAKRGLPPKDRAKEQAVRKARDKARTRKSPSSSQSTPETKQGPRGQLKEVYYRLVVVRDMARSRGVKL